MKIVLVVEDVADLRELFIKILLDGGYRAVGAANCDHALAVLGSLGREPCLVLLDMMMPVGQGRMFLDTLHHMHQVAPLPILVSARLQAPRTLIKKAASPKVIMELVRDYCGTPDGPLEHSAGSP